MVKFNENNEIISEEHSRCILTGLIHDKEDEYSVKELEGLAEAAGAEVTGIMMQAAEKPNPATLIGKGKVEELAEMCENMEVELVIFNNELSGIQIRNLEEKVKVRVIDRTVLILDIFASRAVSKEGKLQVELAQLQYRRSRLTGLGGALSRLGGGIGTRGPGEKKLETDRRHIERRIDDIKKELSHIRNNRDVQRSRRERSDIPIIAMVGYTNSGKSALMNKILEMTEADKAPVFEKDMLFATLDTKHRSVILGDNKKIILIDTIGFVSKLPHGLVEAFKSTLEEILFADLLLHVVDASDEKCYFQMKVTDKVIDEIGAGKIEKWVLYNKVDLIEDMSKGIHQGQTSYISAKRGDNVKTLLDRLEKDMFEDMKEMTLMIPYDKGELSSYLYSEGGVLSVEHKETGTLFKVRVPYKDYNRLKEYEVL